jgi:hypothetical protein
MSGAILKIKYKKIKVLPPMGKQKHSPPLSLTLIHATESRKPKNREQINWKLITTLPVNSRLEAIEKLNWYALRWKIEIFHKIIKSGCKAESSKLRTAERITKLISVFCILSWRIFWVTMLNRSHSTYAPTMALTQVEINLLDQISKDRKIYPTNNKNLTDYITCIARLGGYLDRRSDQPPGNFVIWRGFRRLTEMTLGFDLALKIVGN